MDNTQFLFVPTLNSLRFVNDQDTSIYDNAEFNGQTDPTIVWHSDYCQIVEKADTKQFQWLSDYTEHEIQIVDRDKQLVATFDTGFDQVGTYVDQRTGDVRGIFRSPVIPFAGLSSGYYYLRIVPKIAAVADGYIESEVFDLRDEHVGSVLIQAGNDENTEFTSFDNGEVMTIRLIRKDWRRVPASERSFLRNSQGRPQVLSSKAFRKINFEIYNVPPYMHEQLHQIFALNNIIINGQSWVSEEGYQEPQYRDINDLSNANVILEAKDNFLYQLPPNLPPILDAVGSNNKIVLTWEDRSLNETQFNIERATSPGGPFTQIATVGPNITTYEDLTAVQATTYYYRINTPENPEYSNVASAIWDIFQAVMRPRNIDSALTLPLILDRNYNLTVDWGDGTQTDIISVDGSITTNDARHTYNSVQDYTVQIFGEIIDGWSCQPDSSGQSPSLIRGEVKDVQIWGQAFVLIEGAFDGQTNMQVTATDIPNLTNSTSLARAFKSNLFSLTDIPNLASWDVSGITDFNEMFFNCREFDGVGLDAWDVSAGVDFSGMFYSCSNSLFNPDFSTWDMSNATDLSEMFRFAYNAVNGFTGIGLSGWTVDNVTDMSFLFDRALKFNQDISGWNVGNVTTMQSMFQGAGTSGFEHTFNQDISGWDVSNVVTFEDMFFISLFNQNITPWDVSGANIFKNMFNTAQSFNQPLNTWDVSNALDMEGMFEGAIVFAGDVTGWDVSNNVVFAEMFERIPGFNQDISGWDVSSGENFEAMFSQCVIFNQDLGGWDMGNAQIISRMFQNCNAFDQDLGDWNIQNVTEGFVFISGGAFSIPNYNSILDISTGWPTKNPQDNVFMDFGASQYNLNTGADFGKQDLENVHNWTIFDGGGVAVVAFQFQIDTQNAGASLINQFQLPLLSGGNYDFQVQWGDGDIDNITLFNDPATLHTYAAPGVYDVVITGTLDGWSFGQTALGSDPLKMLSISEWGVISWTSPGNGARGAFEGCANLDLTGVADSLDFTGVTDVREFFSGCTGLTTIANGASWVTTGVQNFNSFFLNCSSFNDPGVDSWDLTSGQDMGNMFNGCTVFNQPLSNWTTNSFTSTNSMFEGCVAFDSDITTWILSNVTNANSMFSGCTVFDQDVSLFGMGSNLRFDEMFRDCIAFNQDISGWTTIQGTTFEGMFRGCTVFDQPLNSWNMLSATNLSNMFQDAIAFNQPLNTWSLNGVTTMRSMFEGAILFDQDISGWDTSTVTDFLSMFQGAISFDQPIGSWNMNSALLLNSMFQGAQSFNQPLNNWERVGSSLAGVTSMSNMFNNATQFDQDLDAWNTSTVTSMTRMFDDADSFNGDITTWDTGAVTSMLGMFESNPSFNRDIGSWDVSSVISFQNMFLGSQFNQDISGWTINTSAPVDMGSMFSNNGVFNQPIGSWDVSQVTDMAGMFNNSTSFNQDLGNWDIQNLLTASSFMNNVTLSTANYNSILDINTGWPSKNPQNNVVISFGNSQYFLGGDAEAGRDDLINNHNWTITDGGGVLFAFQFDIDTSNISAGSSANNEFQLPLVATGNYNFNVDWGDAMMDSINVWNDPATLHSYAAPGTYTVTITGTCEGWAFQDVGDKLKMTTVSTWGPFNPGNETGQFYGCANLDLTGVTDTLDFTGLTSLQDMFRDCSTLTTVGEIDTWVFPASITALTSMFRGCTNFNDPNISGWDVSNVEAFVGTFALCTSFNVDVSPWTMTAATSLNGMFDGCTVFNQDLDSWSTPLVTNFGVMFRNCPAYNQPMNSWNVSSGTSFIDMFNGCTVFNQDLNSWTIRNDVSVSFLRMFLNASSFNGNVTSWDTSMVTSMGALFSGTSFNQNIGSWNVANVTEMSDMFLDCATFNQNLNGWTTTNLATAANLFQGCTVYNQPMDNWDVSGVQDFTDMFAGCAAFDQDITGWTMAQATSLLRMFNGATVFNQNISTWDTGNVTVFQQMFLNATTFNQPVGSWDTSSANNIADMFNGATAFDQDIGQWDVSGVLFATGFLTNAGMSTANYDLLWHFRTGWASQTLQNGVTFQANGINYTLGSEGDRGRDEVITTFGWTITDAGGVADAFTFMVNTANAGDTGGSEFQLPLSTSQNSLYDFEVDWGDSNSDTITSSVDPNALHTYAAPGVYTITITGFCRGWSFQTPDSGLDDSTKMINISNWGQVRWTNNPNTDGSANNGMFSGCSNMTITCTDAYKSDHANAMSMVRMFFGCSSITNFGGLSLWDSGKITSMDATFNGCTNFTGVGMENWDMTGMSGGSCFRNTFANCSNFNPDISGWTFTSDPGTDIGWQGCFSNCGVFNQDLSGWNMERTVLFSGIFLNCLLLNFDVSSWDVSNCSNFAATFSGCESFTGVGLNQWDVSSGTNFGSMFEKSGFGLNGDAPNLMIEASADITGWDMSSATVLTEMFRNNDTFNQNIGLWNITSACTDLSLMFFATGVTSVFDQNLGSWDVSGVTDFGQMFNGADAYTGQGLNTWNVGSGLLFNAMFQGVASITGDITGWNMSSAINLDSMFQNTTFNQNIGGWNVSSVTNFRDLFSGTPFNQDISSWNVSAGQDFRGMFTNCTAFNQDLTGWVLSSATQVNDMFNGCSSFTGINACIDGFNIPATVTDANQMFRNCDLTGAFDLSGWNLSGCTQFTEMFINNPNATTFNVNGWDVSSAIELTGMFSGCSLFNDNISSWNVSSCTSFASMFSNCPAFNQDISGWNVSSGQDFGAMFFDASIFNQPIGSWTMSSATDLGTMFRNAAAFNQDISGWDISNVTIGNNFMTGTPAFSTANYDLLLQAWALLSVQPGVTFNFTAQYTIATSQASRDILTNAPNNWVITDGGGI